MGRRSVDVGVAEDVDMREKGAEALAFLEICLDAVGIARMEEVMCPKSFKEQMLVVSNIRTKLQFISNCIRVIDNNAVFFDGVVELSKNASHMCFLNIGNVHVIIMRTQLLEYQ